MPLLDLFKRSDRQDVPRQPPKDDPFGSPEIQKKRYEAAVEFLGLLQDKFLATNGSVHAGTVLSAAAWLTGTSLYRSLNYRQNPTAGTVVLSNEVNEVGSQIMNMFMYTLRQKGISLKPDQLIINPPAEHKPLLDILQVQGEFQDRYNAIMKKHGLDYLDGAKAGTIVCSIVFQYHCVQRHDMDPRLGAGMISMGILTGAKTSPPPLKPADSSPAPAQDNSAHNNQLAEILKSIAVNSTNGSGTRLALGEGMAALQDTITNGGKYILLHPEVENKLRQSNIDPYLIYETALRIELESSISRVDVVSGNVDELVQEWNGKPQQAPVHARQVLWMTAKAGRFGYERSGNGWTLK